MAKPAPEFSEAPGKPSFLALLEVHTHLNQLFLLHQEAVLRLDVADARETLDVYEREIREHISFEEVELFPIYERAEPIAGGGIDLLRREHEKLLRYIGGMRKSLDTLRPRNSGGPSRIIDLLEFEAKYKGLLMHHDLRERNIFYPALDGLASEEEAKNLLEPQPVGA